MLKYVLAFYIISLCDSTRSITGTYKELVLAETFPITQFFYQEIYYPNIYTTVDKLTRYLNDHRPIFDAKRWVIDKLSAYNENNVLLTNCVNSSGHELRLKRDLLDDDLKQALETQWPSLTLSGNEIERWAINYHDFGSCVSENPVTFFQDALQLLQNHDVGTILSKNKINAGKHYKFRRIHNRIKSVIRKRIYVDCIETMNSDKQYLSAVHICLNKTHGLTDCQHRKDRSNIHNCDTSKRVYYPVVPEDYY